MFIRSYTGISWTRQNILAYIKQKNEEYNKQKHFWEKVKWYFRWFFSFSMVQRILTLKVFFIELTVIIHALKTKVKQNYTTKNPFRLSSCKNVSKESFSKDLNVLSCRLVFSRFLDLRGNPRIVKEKPSSFLLSDYTSLTFVVLENHLFPKTFCFSISAQL